ncbi:MAG TPA: prolyl oligopeptidase family serine peptidase [Gammaproteobacteria bacterium]|nr:prolyl oligopeptidase family serine peptidase [Luteimonas sp.]HRO26085.1 prolyl oligopeptidase family serine peptidase [Luteimonas sp.]HRP35594.1 prolyl oligopeptidase family serine peptidase [Gammaproteobacteria bacterium]HRP71060.1 prolyl oligopeptidase family serine peptidase [Luteimonas sp.]
MKSKFVQLATLSLCLAAGGSVAAEPIPIESFAREPDIRFVSMSTDGKNLVAIVALPGSNNRETGLATWDLDNLDAGSIIKPSGDRMKFVQANAMKADRVLVIGRQEWTGQLGGCGEGRVSGSTKTFVTKAYLTDAKQEKFGEAFADNTRKIGVSQEMQRCLEIAGTASLVSTLPLDPDKVIIRQMNAVNLSGNYYLYNLRTNETELLLRAGGRTEPGLFNPRNGELLTRTQIEPIAADEFEQRVLIRNPKSGEFETHDNLTRRLSERYTVNIVGIDEKTGNFYVLTDLFSDQVQAWIYDPAARKFEDEPLLAHPQFSISQLILGAQPSNFNRILGFTVSGPVPEVVYVDPDMQSIQSALKKAYPGQSIYITGYNNDLSRVLFSTESAQEPPAYHVLLDRKQIKTLGSERPWIKPSSIGEQRWVTYEARDGLKIPAILDLPAGWKQGDAALPTIIHPHGGPWARDFGGWDGSGWVPFLTSRGYAVLRPQYRGSAGLGRKLWLAGDAEWGQKMQDDKDDGAAWLVKQGIADAERLAIFGYSYGGFAAAAAVVRPDSPYQCAISGAPVTDLAKIGRSWSDDRLQRILQGNTLKGMDPMRNTDKANIPVLLYVGDRDVRTPSFHASDFYNGVRNKVAARYELIPDMPHSMPWYYRHHVTTLGLIGDFLSKDCGPGGL